jgi:hypothetical protein
MFTAQPIKETTNISLISLRENDNLFLNAITNKFNSKVHSTLFTSDLVQMQQNMFLLNQLVLAACGGFNKQKSKFQIISYLIIRLYFTGFLN